MQVEVWENEKYCGTARVDRRMLSHLFRVLPKFQESLYDQIETQRTRLLFLLEHSVTKKRERVYFGHPKM